MTKQECECQKDAARKLLSEVTTTAERAKAVFMLIEAYYYGHSDVPSLEVYASHWLWASQRDVDIPSDALAALVQRYPFPSHPKIQMGFNAWNSYNRPGYHY